MRIFRLAVDGVISLVAFAALLDVTALAKTAPAARAFGVEAGSQPLVYAVNEYGYSVSAFGQSGTGNVSPAIDIAGSRTKIYEPVGLAVDQSGELAVSDSANDITLYAAGANGNVAPLGIITCGPGGTPGVPAEIAFDDRRNLYALYAGGYHAPSDAIEVYAPSQQSGCVTDTHVIFGDRTGVSSFGGIAVARDTIYDASGSGVEEFHTSDSGNVPPFVVIEGSKTGLANANGVAVDRKGYLYVSNTTDVVVFAPNARKNATPVAVISGSKTLIPQSGYGALSIAVGKNAEIFVGVVDASQNSRILVFAPGSNGNVAPVRVIDGQRTGLDWPAELAIRN